MQSLLGSLPKKRNEQSFWLEHLSQRGLKTLWASASFGDGFQLLEHQYAAQARSHGLPFASSSDPVSETLRYLILQRLGENPTPLSLRYVPLPVAELCQLSLLWALAGQTEAAYRLARSIPLDFPWLWSSEKQYSDQETKGSIALLRRALGTSSAIYTGDDPFFQALAASLPSLQTAGDSSNVLPWSCWERDPLQCACTFTGQGAPLGAAIFPRGSIRAFGPQTLPLGPSDGFGIRPVEGAKHEWSSCSGLPEVWFKTMVRMQEHGVILDLEFAGLCKETPLAFVFYVKAGDAHIGSQVVKPRGLHRYAGEAKAVCFDGMKIESLFGGNLEVIPLAGLDCFWGCEYLISFQLNYSNCKHSFSISLQ